jgi:ATP-dependent DNA helicase RecQ
LYIPENVDAPYEASYSSAGIRKTYVSGRKRSAAESLEEGDKRIFESLRALRTKIAKESRLHPYIIFSDRTLAYMAVERPRTKEEMLKISGVGQYKYEKYGERFLKVLNEAYY